MIRTSVALAAAAMLLTAGAHAQSPCGLLTSDQIKAVLSIPVQTGQPGSNDCTWKDTKGQDRVYVTIKDAADFHDTRSAMQSTGRMVPLTGVGEDAFIVASTGTSAALYTLKKHHTILLTVTGPNFDKGQNEAAEKALATQLLTKL
jgi:hypothetical protein